MKTEIEMAEVEDFEGDDIEIMDRVRMKIDIVSQEVFEALWRQLSETIWVANHDRGEWEGDRSGDLNLALEEINALTGCFPADLTAEEVTGVLVEVVYTVMDHAHMHSLPIAEKLLDYAKEQQYTEDTEEVIEGESAEEKDATISS